MCIHCSTSYGITKALALKKCCMEHSADRPDSSWTRGWWCWRKYKGRKTNIISRFLFQWDWMTVLFIIDVAHCNWAIVILEIALGDDIILMAQIWSLLLGDQIFTHYDSSCSESWWEEVHSVRPIQCLYSYHVAIPLIFHSSAFRLLRERLTSIESFCLFNWEPPLQWDTKICILCAHSYKFVYIPLPQNHLS